MEEQVLNGTQRKMRRVPGWLRCLFTVAVTAIVLIGGFCLLMGKSGLALVDGWILARYAFVEANADLNEAADQALGALVNGLGDRWSYYMDEESYQQTMTRRANNYVGVGVVITYESELGLLVQNVTEDGPAEQAGVIPGDIIIAVDGTSLAGDARYEGANLIQGEEGTEVELTLLGTDGAQRTVVCTRATLKKLSATSIMLEDGIGYIQLTNFYSGAADSLRSEVERLLASGAESLIIDVRNNPGGYTTELKAMLDYLLPEGAVFTEKSRWWFSSTYESDADCVDLPMVVLVNKDSYSAAELLAAQLRESAGSPIVGEVTSGKGYYQITYALPNGGGMGLSSGTYCTGSGHSLIGEGIMPDVLLELAADEDNQLQAAIDLLKK